MSRRVVYYGNSYGSGIVTDDLILYLDAGNPLSYAGTGTLWTDLSSLGNNATLINSPTFDSNDGGSIVFNGIDDYAEITQNNDYRFSNTQPFTLSFWVKCTSVSGFVSILAYARFDANQFIGASRGYYFFMDVNFLRTNSYLFDYSQGFTQAGSIFRGIQGNDNSLDTNSWINIVATSATNSVNDMKVYKNGVLTSWTNRGAATPATINYTNVPFQIGARDNVFNFKGNISQVLVYNRVISDTEILQNFNAVKSRYGL